MPESILIDANFLYALNDPTDKHHTNAVEFAENDASTRIIPTVVLTEVTYLLREYVGQRAGVNFLSSLSDADYTLEPVTKDDLPRVAEIMLTYPEARLDFVDCCIMALSEKLNIKRVCTFDRRDFVIFRPRHTDYLDLLP